MEPGNHRYSPFAIAGAVFDDLVPRFCADCPSAAAETAVQARKMNTMFSKEAGCCSMCASYAGFFCNDLSFFLKEGDATGSERLMEFLCKKENDAKEAHGFDEAYGFFEPSSHSCRIPRDSRSITCTVYYCRKMRDALGKDGVSAIDRQKKRMVDSRKEEMLCM